MLVDAALTPMPPKYQVTRATLARHDGGGWRVQRGVVPRLKS